MKTLLTVLSLLASLPWGAQQFVVASDANAAAASHHEPHPHIPSLATPADIAESETGASAPCGMVNCVNMVGCTGNGAAVRAGSASLLTGTVAAPADLPLVLAFQTATRTAVPPPPRA